MYRGGRRLGKGRRKGAAEIRARTQEEKTEQGVLFLGKKKTVVREKIQHPRTRSSKRWHRGGKNRDARRSTVGGARDKRPKRRGVGERKKPYLLVSPSTRARLDLGLMTQSRTTQKKGKGTAFFVSTNYRLLLNWRDLVKGGGNRW